MRLPQAAMTGYGHTDGSKPLDLALGTKAACLGNQGVLGTFGDHSRQRSENRSGTAPGRLGDRSKPLRDRSGPLGDRSGTARGPLGDRSGTARQLSKLKPTSMCIRSSQEMVLGPSLLLTERSPSCRVVPERSPSVPERFLNDFEQSRAVPERFPTGARAFLERFSIEWSPSGLRAVCELCEKPQCRVVLAIPCWWADLGHLQSLPALSHLLQSVTGCAATCPSISI